MKNYHRFRFLLSRLTRSWIIPCFLLLALPIFGSAASADTEYFGNLVNDNGKVGISVCTFLDGVLQPDTVWTLAWGTSADTDPADRVTITSGVTTLGDRGTTVFLNGNLLDFWGIDPSFEISGPNQNVAGFVSPWTKVKTGDGVPAFYTNYEGDAIPAGGWLAVPAQKEVGSRDVAHPAGILRSGVFTLTGDAITFQLRGGPNDVSLPIPTDEDHTAGFMGVALRDANTGAYLATAQRIGGGSNDWQLCGFSSGNVLNFDSLIGLDVTLDLIDDYSGGWGWMTIDNFQMIGDLPWDANLVYFLTVGDMTVSFGTPLEGGNDVPEPAAWVLMALGAAGLAVRRRKTRFFRAASFLFLGFCVFGFSVAKAQAPVPELRVFDILGDSIIRSDLVNWNYLAAVRYTNDGGSSNFDVSGVTFYRHESPWNVFAPVAPGLSFAWSGAVENYGATAGETPSYMSGSAIKGVFAGSLYNGTDNANNGRDRALTISGLDVGSYYTIQIFNSTTRWDSTRNGVFSFYSDAGGSPDTFQIFGSNYGFPQNQTTSITLNEQNVAGNFPNLIPTNSGGPPNPANLVSIEYTFQATATNMKIDLESLDRNNSWHFYGLAVAQHEFNPFVPTGTLTNNNGTLLASLASFDGETKLPLNVNWKLEVAGSEDGPRTTLTGGITAANGSAFTPKENAFLSLGLDPSFEAAGRGESTPWQIVLNGRGEAPYGTSFDVIYSAQDGDYFAVPGQTTVGDRDNGGVGSPGILRSGEFTLLPGDEVSFRIAAGNGSDVRPTNENNISGFLGVALRDAVTGDYLLTKRRSGAERDWQEVMFTADEILGVMTGDTLKVTLDLIDDYNGGWGFACFDDFQLLRGFEIDPKLYYFLSVEGYGDVAMLGPGMNDETDVPEPAAWVLMVLSVVGLGMMRKICRA